MQISVQTDHEQPSQPDPRTPPSFYSSSTFRGGLIGIGLTAFISWNTGPHGRVGKFLKHWRFVRHFVSPKTFPYFVDITKYHHANLSIVANNFYCYSGESGIGKSHHFQNVVAKESLIRPSLYVSFKGVGRQENFQNDLSQQLNYGTIPGKGGIVGQIVRAILDIKKMNENPQELKKKYHLTHLFLLAISATIICLPLILQFKLALLGPVLYSQSRYYNFMQPLLKQSKRGTFPLVVFDDLNKLEHLGMLAEITRFFHIKQSKSANLIMISSNQETWAKLRHQPGMKDRLRIRQIKYDHQKTSELLLQLIDSHPEQFQSFFTYHPMFAKNIIKELVKVFIGNKQMSIRRFTSVLKLVDEEEYQKIVQTLENIKKLAPTEEVVLLRQIIFRSEVDTMVAHFRRIKRELPNMSHKIYVDTLKAVVKYHRLPSDNRVGDLLKVYNIMRDQRAVYVVNGGYILKIFEMAMEEYVSQMKQFDLPQYKKGDFSPQY